MGCDASVLAVTGDDPAVGPDALAASAIDRLHQLERRWSRFVAGSEISTLNAAGGAPVRVSADTVAVVTSMVQAWHATEGTYDPTLLAPLVGLGYAASRDDRTRRTSLPAGSAHRGRPDLIEVDPDRCIVRLPARTTIDPGGIGKGVAADLVAAELLARGATGALVEIGGDLRVVGTPPSDDAWTIAIDPHRSGQPDGHVRLLDGGVATSSTRLRTWVRPGDTRPAHHLLDPATGHPTGHAGDDGSGDVVACTIVAGTAAWADAFTKAPFVVGADAGVALLAAVGLAARVTTADGNVLTTTPWNALAREELAS
jgi:thiamine biosynthesis lipoprotein